MKKPELLIPAGSLEVLKTAVVFGADAVYIGGEAFGLRAKAKNFGKEEMEEGIRFAHEYGVKVHVTANILAHNGDLSGAEDYLKELKALKPDALIVADPGIFTIAREICPEIDIHISTQANNTNYGTFRFWGRQGAKRVVSARELSLAEIKEIRENIPEDLEIESFIHGAMCISYSGRCLLSSYFTGRDANQGACTHPCRWKYAVMEEKRPGEFFPVYENERGTYIFNSKDLCMIEHIPEMIDAGIDSFKIEGRMKTALYVATVARTYRKAIDDYMESEEKYRKNMDWYKTEENLYTNDGNKIKVLCLDSQDNGTVEEKDKEGRAKISQRNKFCVGDTIEIMKPDGRNIETTVLSLTTQEGESVESAPHPKQTLFIGMTQEAETGDILRMRN